jgi:hypothetical protein
LRSSLLALLCGKWEIVNAAAVKEKKPAMKLFLKPENRIEEKSAPSILRFSQVAHLGLQAVGPKGRNEISRSASATGNLTEERRPGRGDGKRRHAVYAFLCA